MSSDTVMTAAQVGDVAVAIPDVRVRALARSHERLRAMFEEASVRIAKQSDALTRRAEPAAGDQQDPSAIRR
jgi:two-component sensor histidine kinase